MKKDIEPSNKTLSESGGENALVERIAHWMRFNTSVPAAPTPRPPWATQNILTGIGDDTALVQLGEKQQGPRLALTTDLLVEGTHFLPTHPPQDLGAKAVEVNLSDLAATGAWPTWILVSLGVPGGISSQWIEALYAGIREALAPYECPCLGGDTVRAERVVLNIVAGGLLAPGVQPPLRCRAQTGQALYVTGTLGDSRAGLQLLLEQDVPHASPSSLSERDRAFLVQRHQHPRARVAVGCEIARLCPDAAMMDLSDGLACDLPRLARAARCGFDVRLKTLPLSPALRRYAATGGGAPEQIALTGGEDYELLFTTAKPLESWEGAVARANGKRPLRITRIGTVTEESQGIRFLGSRGNKIQPAEPSFLHFEEKTPLS